MNSDNYGRRTGRYLPGEVPAKLDANFPRMHAGRDGSAMGDDAQVRVRLGAAVVVGWNVDE
jgi:hypothetical protein